LGYEIYCKPQYLLRLAEAVEVAGADLGYRWYGARALMSMRLEKSWGAWTLEFRPDFDAVESGMDAFINLKKDFVGKAATQAAQDAGPARKLVTMIIDAQGIDVSSDEAILKDGVAVGYVSSGGFGHRSGKSLAMGYVSADHTAAGTVLEVEILGQMYRAEILGGPIYDPDGARMRA
jgi:dimethylglycine dehydrogenase